MQRSIGMSTGVLYKTVSSVSQRIIDFQKLLGGGAVELGCIRSKKLFDLDGLDALDIRNHFKHLSLHAPTYLKYGESYESILILETIAEEHKRFQFDRVVFHPDTVKDWSVLNNLSFPIGVENSDQRKGFGRTVEDLEKVFSGTDFGFVLDVNHCFTVDKSMALARIMVDRFSDRLCEIHLSGFAGYHEPIFITRQMEILKAVPSGNAPIIIESVCRNEEEARQELQYVTDYFSLS